MSHTLKVLGPEDGKLTVVEEFTGGLVEVRAKLCKYLLSFLQVSGDGDGPDWAAYRERANHQAVVVANRPGVTVLSGDALGLRYDEMVFLHHTLPFAPLIDADNLKRGAAGGFIKEDRSLGVALRRVGRSPRAAPQPA